MLSRVPFFDNLKAVLIVLVVVGHFLLPIHNDIKIAGYCYEIIYFFHMPLFVFTSGLFGKSVYRNGSLRWQRIISFLLLGLMFNFTLILIEKNVGFSTLREELLLFESAPWYLIALAWWYLITPLFSRIRPAAGLTIAFTFSILSGLFSQMGDFLAVSRTVVFLPFYLAGYYCPVNACLGFRQKRKLRVIIVLAGLCAIMLFPFVSDYFKPILAASYGNNPYGETTCLVDMFSRVLLFVVAILLSVWTLMLVPTSKAFYSILGSRTLQVYIWHRLIRGVLVKMGFFSFTLQMGDYTCLIILLLASLLITALCSIPILGLPIDFIANREWHSLEAGKSQASS